MKRLICFVVGLGMLVALSACSTTVSGTAAVATSPGLARPAFAPYVDTSVKRPDLVAANKETGVKHITLAFALAGKGGGCEPAWGGTEPLDALKAEIDGFKAVGGSFSVATGGANGPYLENACGSAGELKAAYEKILDSAGTNFLDVDIEAPVQNDKVVDALSQLQQERGTDITLTLPVDLGGLPAPTLDLVQRAAAANVVVTVNAMDMNFRTGGDWGQAMVDAAQATLDQLRRIYPNASEAVQNRTLAITVEVGRNDVAGVVTRPEDAQKLIDFAKSRGVSRLAFWSLARDNGSCPKKTQAQPNCSGIPQADLQFTKQFVGFTGPTTA